MGRKTYNTVWIRKKENLNFLQFVNFRYKRFISNNPFLGGKNVVQANLDLSKQPQFLFLNLRVVLSKKGLCSESENGSAKKMSYVGI